MIIIFSLQNILLTMLQLNYRYYGLFYKKLFWFFSYSQDDFIDCFGVEKVTGKVGTDIQEGKCSWLAVQAAQRCNEKQMRVFSACYGSSEPAHIERIKRLYEELDLPTVYRNEEKARHDLIVRLVQDFPSDTISSDLFLKLLNRIYDRKK